MGARNAAPPIFLHSSFRTCSTWLWSKFREDQATLAFNEYFNEMLAGLTPQMATTHATNAWDSGHPATEPYFLEFLPLIQQPSGVRGYLRDMGLRRIIPEAGIRGPLSDAEQGYVASLIALAHQKGKTPVLACTRTLGRAGGLKHAFGGLHVLLHRNLFHQWSSYVHQAEAGNPYFLMSTAILFLQAARDPFVRRLYAAIAPQCDGDILNLVKDDYREPMFITFFAAHLYLSMLAFEACDLAIDANRLPESAYRIQIERAVWERTAVCIDLGDVQISSKVSIRPLKRPDRLWNAITALFEQAVADSAVGADAAAFGRRLLTEGQRGHRPPTPLPMAAEISL